MIEVKVKRTRAAKDPLELPAYQTLHSAGMDLLADIDSPVRLEAGQRALVSTGIAIELPEGYEAQVRPRSGLALKKGIGLVNSPGTIDADYRGEIGVILINWGAEPVIIERGDRIAQMVVAPVTRAILIEASDLTGTQRAAGGFGSTGNK